MKLVFFNNYSLGVLRDDGVVDVMKAVKDIPRVTPQNLIAGVIANFASLKDGLEAMAQKGKAVPAASVRIRPPLPKPVHIVAMAVNYMENGALKEPPKINAFLKSPSGIIGDGDTIVLPDAPATIFHHECELAVIIGKEAKNVKRTDAYGYIFGYTNFMDISARGLGAGSFFWGKSWDTFGPMGPCIVTADEIKTPQDLVMRLWVNGEPRHEFSTSDMAHDITRCVEWVTSVTTLEPGDIITTGTNHQGIGAVQHGDVVEQEGQGLGRLKVYVKDENGREWPKGIDTATANRMAGRSRSGGFGTPAR